MCWNQGVIKCDAERYLQHYPGQHPHLQMRKEIGTQWTWPVVLKLISVASVSPRNTLEMLVLGSHHSRPAETLGRSVAICI